MTDAQVRGEHGVEEVTADRLVLAAEQAQEHHVHARVDPQGFVEVKGHAHAGQPRSLDMTRQGRPSAGFVWLADRARAGGWRSGRRTSWTG